MPGVLRALTIGLTAFLTVVDLFATQAILPAGFMKLRPTPPKISLAKTTPKLTPRATCHSGMVGGRVRVNSRPVTRKASENSWPRR
jgi:hypothetical protein